MRGISVVRYVGVAILAASVVCIQPGVGYAASDAWITTKAKIALLTTAGVSSNAVNVDTVDGIVTLHGKASSAEEKSKAEVEVKKIEGVKEVRNLLQVIPSAHEKVVNASDKEIKDKVDRTLRDAHFAKDSRIEGQSVNNGVVLLGGKAQTLTDHLRAVELARSVPGVRKVESEIESPDRLADDEIRRQSEPSRTGSRAESGHRGMGAAAKDMSITADAKMRLLADPDVPALDINVDTFNGGVTLWGAVPTAKAKAAAEADVRKISGVARVRNELQVVPVARKEAVKAEDRDLKDQVKKAIQARDDLKGANINVDVKNGVARLTGTVDEEQQRLMAAIVARSTPGVRAVQNDTRLNVASR